MELICSICYYNREIDLRAVNSSMIVYLQMIETDEDKSKFEEIYFVYHFEGSSDVNKELVDYRPTLIPNGYTEFYSDTTEDTIIVVYANEEGEMLKFSYSHNPDNTTWFVGADSLTVQPITINGISGEAITSTEQGAATAIMWITTENTAFNISGFLSVEDLIAMAESVQIIKP